MESIMKKYFYLALALGLLNANMGMSSNSGFGANQDWEFPGHNRSQYEQHRNDDLKMFIKSFLNEVITDSEANANSTHWLEYDEKEGEYKTVYSPVKYFNEDLLVQMIAPSLRKVIKEDEKCGYKAKKYLKAIKSIFMETGASDHTILMHVLFEDNLLSFDDLMDLKIDYPKEYGRKKHEHALDLSGKCLAIAVSFMEGRGRIYTQQPSFREGNYKGTSAPLMHEM